MSSQILIERVQNALSETGFEQRPQSDGENRSPVLGSGSGASPVDDADRPQRPHSGASATPDDLEGRFAGLLEEFARSLRKGSSVSGLARSGADRHLVYVHGISEHIAGYSDTWWNSLRSYTDAFGPGSRGATRHEVLWSDLVNDRAVAMAGGGKEAELRARIADVMEDRARLEAVRAIQAARAAGRTLPRPSERRLELASAATARGGGFAIDDFLRYMTSDETRRRIIERFTDVVRPLLASGKTLDIVTHSWGTVVAYEGLRELGGGFFGRVHSFFTVGSALSLPPVRSALRSENKDGGKPTSVDRWINLDAQGDLVGGALGDYFDVDQEELDLTPTGCKRTLWGWGPYPPGCAHSSYFVAGNEYVNRVVFASNINR